MTTSTSRLLTAATLASFGEWCEEARGDHALAVRETNGALSRIAFAADDGSMWTLDAADTALTASALRTAVQSGCQWWARDATAVARAVHAATGLRLRGLRCTRTVERALHPDVMSSGDEAPGSRTPTAVETARWVASTRKTSTKDLLHTSVRECKVDDAWRWPAARGYRVDTAALAREAERLDALRADSLKTHGLDLTRDTDDVRRWLITRGIHITDPHGAPSLSRRHYGRGTPPPSAMEDWKAFVELREAASVAGKVSEIQAALSPAGRVHPTIRGIGAKTGRTTVGGPALQNLPSRLRGLLLAEPGMVLVGCDLDRVEPRVVAALSTDPALVKAVQADVYTELAVAIWGESARGDELRRKTAKTALVAIIYGQGSTTLAAEIGGQEDDARELIADILRAYPDMARWLREVKRRAQDGELLSTACGRPLPLTTDAPYRAVNWIVQGTAADLFKTMTLAAAERLGRDALWLPVHDELIVQVPEANAPQAARVLGEVMSTQLNGVPITGSPVILGARWRKI